MEREREKKDFRHVLCYKIYKTLHGMKHHTQSQSTFSFCLIKLYQPFSQTRTSTTHNQTTFHRVSVSIVIFHTAHRATGRSSLVVYIYTKQYRIFRLARVCAQERVRAGTHKLIHVRARTRARTHAHTHTHATREGMER